MMRYHNNARDNHTQFECLNWGPQENSEPHTPGITPGYFECSNDFRRSTCSSQKCITYGIHWNHNTYPTWSGAAANNTYKAPHNECIPFSIQHIAHMCDQIMDIFGFQFDVSLNVFELLMSQLDSRASRSDPSHALRSLHSDYISGIQANYRKWYFAAEMDQIDAARKVSSASNSNNDNSNNSSNDTRDIEDDEYTALGRIEEEEYLWQCRYNAMSNEELLVQLLLYLFCWTEANQIRFMPECLAFLFKCCIDYYNSNFSPFPQHSRAIPDLPQYFFLDRIITPLYNAYCYYNFTQTEKGELIRREGDHKNIVGYDDMNQLFWYRLGIEKIKVKNPDFDPSNTQMLQNDVNCEMKSIIDVPKHQRLLYLADFDWKPVFTKTYRESRSWLHNFTNFSRIWILHTSVFWFFTAYHVPSLYSPESTFDHPVPPKEFVKWTIMSFGGAFGPLITLIGLFGELRFVPRSFAGAKPILPRLTLVIFMLLILLAPGACNLALNSWNSDDTDLIPATVTSGVLFGIAIIYSVYLSFQPLDSIHGYNSYKSLSGRNTRNARKFLASWIFTGNFPKREFSDACLSHVFCLLVFVAKFTESYFFLTLSIRDPVFELRIMSLSQNCIGDRFLMGKYLCKIYPRILLGLILLTDMVLFFLDTYLWYVILNTAISVSISLKSGTSVWTPWKNVYSRLGARIYTKIVASAYNGNSKTTSAQQLESLRIIWNSIIENMLYGHVLSKDHAYRLMHLNASPEEPAFFSIKEDASAFGHDKTNSNATRRISFFAQSLSTPMKHAISVYEMPGFTVLVPHYKETMILGLSESINADMGAKVTILEYLQRLYPSEWDNFVEFNQRKLNSNSELSHELHSNGTNIIHSASSILAMKNLGFSSLDPNDTVKTRLWCSERTQTLVRTLKGFSNYSKALKVLYFAEEPKEDFEHGENIHEIAQNLCDRKFKLLVAMQTYNQYNSEQLRDVEIMLHLIPELTISYIEYEIATDKYYACHIDGTCPVLDNGKRKPRIRIRLSGNPILGDGKADNQNTALPFYRGEFIQLVDANQDNYLEECLKIRNVLMEFEPEKNDVSSRCPNSWDLESGFYTDKVNSILNPDISPVAIVGAREYIFSENIGVLGDVAAGKEQTFGTLFSRTLAKVGAKLHYGHPDFLNAIFMVTRGGVSKAQGGLHLNEDIYAGMTAMLRGGRIKHSEYFQCGKGRDLGFMSILNFTAKIGSGMGEQILSREYFYIGTQLPFDRFMAFYYAHPGFHLNNALIMLSLEMLMIVILWISSIGAVNTLCTSPKQSSSFEPRRPTGCANISPLLDWVKRCIISIFLVFFVSLCPLFLQEFIERGFVKSMMRIMRHFCSLSMLFEVFTCRIYARNFWEDMNTGGAKYLATGRGLAISRVSFVKIYAGFYPEIISGCKATMIILFSSMVVWKLEYLWFWMTCVSLCLCPFLYNPHQFAFTGFFGDYFQLLKWFWKSRIGEENEIHELGSWTIFIREIRKTTTGVKIRLDKSSGTKPSFRNVAMSKIGNSILLMLVIGFPFIFMGSQKTSRYQHEPSKTSNLVLMLEVTMISTFSSIIICAAAFVLAIVFNTCSIRQHSSFLALMAHNITLLVVIVSWWIVYIICDKSLNMWMLGIGFMCTLHHCWHTILTILIVRRQRTHQKTNDPWWRGDWWNANVGCKLPFVILEELLVKHMECLQYSYDFLICHFILGIQTPIIMLPCIDKIHMLFLMWLKPGVAGAASRTCSVKRRKYLKTISGFSCALFIAIAGTLSLLIAFPLYAPEKVTEAIESLITKVTEQING